MTSLDPWASELKKLLLASRKFALPEYRTKLFLNPANRINLSQELTLERIFLLAEGLPFWASVLTLSVPIVTNNNFLLTISIHCQEIKL